MDVVQFCCCCLRRLLIGGVWGEGGFMRRLFGCCVVLCCVWGLFMWLLILLGNDVASLAFDKSGKFLAVGYNAGQVVLLSQQDEQIYQLYTEFKSHVSAFDCLTSTEIEEKITGVQWYPFSTEREQYLLTTNEKTTKLFKVYTNGVHDDGTDNVVTTQRKVFDGAHTFNINSISFNSDGESFLTGDDLRVNLWNLEVSDESYILIDIKPDNMDDLVEVITSSTFHPTNCNLLAYASSKGIIRYFDLRESSSCNKIAGEFEDVNSNIGGFFRELVSTISDIKFSPNGQFIASRDYLSLKIWDSRMNTAPVTTVQHNPQLTSKLCDLYETGSIFDRFKCDWSPDSTRVLTGSYNNNFYVCEAFGQNTTKLSALRPGLSQRTTFKQFDDSNRVSSCVWHPTTDIIATGVKDFGYLYVNNSTI
eukprot:TRINITY_DN1323_c1_g1_i1.p1 TRINITY_DN1323_c1_g1~~TRINITY_DN1323_c1_g1_i1.p1  ORF type:complete len:419 (+),score=78.87 TRINITY_DN1323_c1_g1_i1:207-1463(+)